MSRSKKFDFLFLIFLALISIPLVVHEHTRFLTSAVIFLGFPSLYLVCRRTQNLKIIFSGVFLIGVLLGFIFDFLATLNHAWLVPDDQLIFSYRVLGTAPIDELIFLVLWVLLMLLVYEHFFERKRIEHLHVKHFIFTGLIPAFFSITVILLLFFANQKYVSFPYAYLVLGLLAAIPLIYFAFQEPKALTKVIKAAPYFIFLFLAFELTALYLHQWSFPGQYVGYVELFSFKFPLEELIFWIVTSSTVVLADYKLFVDDK